MPVTMRIIIPDSGSSRKLHGATKEPHPSVVWSGIAGIHSATTTVWKRSSSGRPSSWKKAFRASRNDSPMVAHATSPAVCLLNERIPTRPLMAAPSPGSSGINQIRSMTPGRRSALRLLSPVSCLLRGPRDHHFMIVISSMFTVSLLR